VQRRSRRAPHIVWQRSHPKIPPGRSFATTSPPAVRDHPKRRSETAILLAQAPVAGSDVPRSVPRQFCGTNSPKACESPHLSTHHCRNTPVTRRPLALPAHPRHRSFWCVVHDCLPPRQLPRRRAAVERARHHPCLRSLQPFRCGVQEARFCITSLIGSRAHFHGWHWVLDRQNNSRTAAHWSSFASYGASHSHRRQTACSALHAAALTLPTCTAPHTPHSCPSLAPLQRCAPRCRV
jgi:hypothetical protein